jgi:hypothetical protein
MAFDLFYNRTGVVQLPPTGSYGNLVTLNVTPVKYTKFIILAKGDTRNQFDKDPPYKNERTNHEIDYRLQIGGTTYAETSPFMHFSGAAFVELPLNQQTTINLQAKQRLSNGFQVDRARVVAIGVPEWEMVEQADLQTTEIEGTENRVAKFLMQHFFHSEYSDALVITYAELNQFTNNTESKLSVYLDDDTNNNNVLSEVGLVRSDRAWESIASIERLRITRGQHSLVFKATKLTDNIGKHQFRRLRAAIIPIDRSPFTVIQSQQHVGRDAFTAAQSDAEEDNIITMRPQTFAGLTYLILSSLRASPDQPNQEARTTIRYVGFGLEGLTSDTNTDFTDDLANYGYSRGLAAGQLSNIPLKGFQHLSFHVGEATQDAKDHFFMYTDFGPDGPAGGPITDAIAFEHRNLLVLQYQKEEQSLSDNFSYDSKENYNIRVLVELNRSNSVSRYSLTNDTYLLEDKSFSEIISLVQDGSIDRDSLADIVVTGQQALDALDAGNVAQAENLIALQEGLPEGVTPSPDSEYRTLSSIGALYKKGVLRRISISENSPDAFFGIVGSDRASIQLANFNNEFTSEHDIDDILGSTIKVRVYDKTNSELRSVFSGRVTDVRATDTIDITAINPNVDQLDNELPVNKVNDALLTDSSVESLEILDADDPEAGIPIFFGTARRMKLPNIAKSFGDDSTDPDFLNAFSDYVIGGPLFAGKYKNVIPILTYTDLGIYRNWLQIVDNTEFKRFVPDLEAPFESSDVISLENYTVKSNPVPVIRFASIELESTSRSSPLSLPHTATDSTEDPADFYPQFSPVSEILYVQSFNHGPDWVENAGKIDWSPPGDEPDVVAVGTTTLGVVRLNSTGGEDIQGLKQADIITGTTTNQQAAEVLKLNSVVVSGLTHDRDVHFLVRSTNLNREYENKIDWTPIDDLRAEWNFSEDLLDGVTVNANDLTPTGGQDVYNTAKSALEFISPQTTGSVRIIDASITPAGHFDFGVDETQRLVAYVSTNPALELDGVVVSKYSTGTNLGYGIRIAKENTLFAPGDTTKSIAVGFFGNGSTFANVVAGSTLDATRLNDGAIHKIELHFGNSTDIKKGVHLYVDNTEEGYDPFFGTLPNRANSSEFQIGGSLSSFPNLQGLVHKVRLSGGDLDRPLAGVTYNVDFDFQPNTYTAEWEYTKINATNPVQSLPIGIDAKVAGSDIDPIDITSTVPLVGSTTFMWTKGPAETGYAIRLNFPDPDNAWFLGTSTLGETTYLANIGEDGSVEFANNNNAMRVFKDFSLYAYGTWRGTPSGDGILVAKQTNDNAKPSYALGLEGGFAFGAIVTNTTLVTIKGTTPVDQKNPFYMQMDREGTRLKIYVNGVLENSKDVGRSFVQDYANFPLVIGSLAIKNVRWVGDVSFVGLADFSGGEEFAKMQYDLVSRGVKGAWSSKFELGVEKKTLFHIPFTEGTGTVIKSRNLHKNPAQAIKRILHDKNLGLGDDVDGQVFDDAATKLDNLGLKVDFTQQTSRKLSDILADLAIVRGMSLKKSVAGKWTVRVDDAASGITAKFGSGDGLLENIKSIGGLRFRPPDQAIKLLTLNYRQFADREGEVKFHASISRDVLSYGTDIKTFDMPYLIDHKTADKVADYLAKKIRFSAKELQITVGMEGRRLAFGDVVEVNIPRLNINNETFQIIEIAHDGSDTDLTLQGFDPEIFSYSPGPVPEDENIAVSVTA